MPLSMLLWLALTAPPASCDPSLLQLFGERSAQPGPWIAELWKAPATHDGIIEHSAELKQHLDSIRATASHSLNFQRFHATLRVPAAEVRACLESRWGPPAAQTSRESVWVDLTQSERVCVGADVDANATVTFQGTISLRQFVGKGRALGLPRTPRRGTRGILPLDLRPAPGRFETEASEAWHGMLFPGLGSGTRLLEVYERVRPATSQVDLAVILGDAASSELEALRAALTKKWGPPLSSTPTELTWIEAGDRIVLETNDPSFRLWFRAP